MGTGETSSTGNRGGEIFIHVKSKGYWSAPPVAGGSYVAPVRGDLFQAFFQGEVIISEMQALSASKWVRPAGDPAGLVCLIPSEPIETPSLVIRKTPSFSAYSLLRYYDLRWEIGRGATCVPPGTGNRS